MCVILPADVFVTLAQKSCVLVGAWVDAYIVRLVPDSEGIANVEFGSRSERIQQEQQKEHSEIK
jgi:hypothetical protein